jgi:hypothetical protein
MRAGRVRAGVGLVAALVLSLGTVTGPVVATQPVTGERPGITALPVPGSCPRTRAIGAIRPGMTGIGWTTVRGDVPEPFRVRVLGTLHDGIGPDRDLVIIKVADLPGRRVIRAGGGIWSGMSGSPVYIRGRLAGAISYSLADGPSPIGGMTPARYMERLAAEPAHTSASRAAARSGDADGRSVVRVTGALHETVATEQGRSAGRTTVLHRLGVPVVASGGIGGRRSFVGRQLRRTVDGMRLVASGAASTSAASRLADVPRPGQNLAGVIARGDVTVAAVGTVTAVCHRRVIGFGHPMTGEGTVAFGAARARTVAIVGGGDPYKLADIGRTFGALDADRLVGVRAIAGRVPRMLPVTAHVRSRTTGRVRTGRTLVATPEWMPGVAADHLLVDIQTVEDRYGGGTARLDWTIRGVRLDTGTAWTLRRSDIVADPGDISYASALRLYLTLDALVGQPGTEVQVRSVSIDATIMRAATVDRIRRIEVSRNGGPWQRTGPIEVAPGDELRVRVSVRPRDGRTSSSIVTLTVPTGATGDGVVDVLGGPNVPTNGCDPIVGDCPATFGGLLDALRGLPRGDELLVELAMTDTHGEPLRASATTRLAHVVEGERLLVVSAS